VSVYTFISAFKPVNTYTMPPLDRPQARVYIFQSLVVCITIILNARPGVIPGRWNKECPFIWIGHVW
jgi:hypothetical protein